MKMKKMLMILLPFAAIIGFIVFNACKSADNSTSASDANAGLILPAGFSAVAVAEHLGSARHLIVTPEHDIYIHLAGTKNGKGILVLHEEGDKTTLKSSFANFGGTGIAIKNGYLYASNNTSVYRYKLNEKDEVINPDQPEKILPV
jgi:hypothetical protein